MSKPLRLLIIEDSEDEAQLILRELSDKGYAPTYEIVGTPEAMSAALNKQTWDVILDDWTLPRFSGMAALKLLKGKGLDLPFVVVSGTIGEDAAVAAMKAGAHDYMRKDNLARLDAVIERELGEARVRLERKWVAEVAASKTQELENRVQELEAVNRLNVKLLNDRADHLTQVETAKRELQAIFDTIPDGILVLDANRMIWRANQGFAQLVGKPIKLLLGERACRLVHGRDEPIPDCPLMQVLSTGSPQSIELREPYLGGKLLGVYVYPVPGMEKPRFIHCVRVVSQ